MGLSRESSLDCNPLCPTWTEGRRILRGQARALRREEDEVDGGVTYPCADGTTIHPYPSPDNAGKSGRICIALWTVADVEATVDELAAKGVTFEQYGEPFNTDAKGIARFEGDAAGAWFKDPDGNVLALGSRSPPSNR